MRHGKKISVLACVLLTACAAKKNMQTSGIDVAGMDKSVAPGDDFNAYTNGGWIKATPIPADKSSYGNFTILLDKTRERTRELIENASKSPSDGEARKVGDFYASFMDESGIEAKGLKPLEPELSSIAAIKDRRQLAGVIGSRLRADVDPLNNTNFETPNLFGVWVTQGLEDPSKSYPYLLQGGLGLPDRDYYLSESPHMAELRKQYLAHVEAMLKLAGLSDPHGRAARVFALETAMAKVHATRVESEDVRTPVSWNRADFSKKAPGLDWAALFEAAGLNDAPVIIVWHPKAIPGLSALVAKEPIDSWRDWLAYHSIEDAAAFLPKAFVEEHFNFFGKALNGIPEQRPRWQRAVDRRGSDEGVRQAHRRAPLDVAGDEGQGKREIADAQGRRGLSRPVARLFDAGNRQRRRSRQRAARRTVRIPLAIGEAAPTRRSQRVVDDPADRERRQFALAERAQFSGGDFAAAFLRRQCRRGAQLRLDGRGDRP